MQEAPTPEGLYMADLAVRLYHMEFNYLQRVKVYRLNDEGKWDDKGTGHVSVEYLERSDAVGLVVIDEEDNQTLLVHRISADDIYRRQEDTIISWTDPEVATDLALSFQETMGCSFIWDQICSVQRSIHFPSVGLEGNARPVGDDLEHSGTSQDDGGGAETLELPPVELATLPLIAKTVSEVMPFDRDRVAPMIVRDQNYIRKLVQLFRTCEENKNLESLRFLFKIFKGIISLNDGNIFDIIFSDEYIMDTVGALEYDPDVTNFQDHRKFLKEQVTFKEAVPIRDPVILSKIHQTYRIGYIKDVILPRVLDDPTFATINSIMLFNNVSVVTALQNDSAFLSDLFARLRSPDTPERSRRDLVLFVQEFCNLSKHLQPAVRSQLFSALVKHLGLFDLVKDILNDPDEGIRLSGCDILMVVLNHEPALLRTFLVHQPSNTLFSELVEGMLTPSEGGLQAQLLEIMRMLLDSETMDTPPVDKSAFLEIFYEKYMDQMVQLLTDGCPSEPGSTEISNDASVDSGKRTRRTVSPEILGNICELMCFCVQHHRFRIKYYVMRNHVVEKVLKLIRRKEKYLVVAAVRFLRTCVSLKDEFYYRYIVKHNLFESIIGAFMANGNRYNLLNSAVLELIDYIRKDNIKTLIVHLIEKYSSKLECIDYVDTFRALKLKYDQILEGPPSSTRDAGGAVTGSGPDHGSRAGRDRHSAHADFPERIRKDERALDKDEEDYFNEDSDDEEDTATARVSTASQPEATKAVLANGSALDGASFRKSAVGLVDYEDEDEEIPRTLGDNGKDSNTVPQKNSPASPLTDPVWQEVDDGGIAKRKTSLAPSLEQTDATPPKRQKAEDSHAADFDFESLDASRVGSDVISSEVRSIAISVVSASTQEVSPAEEIRGSEVRSIAISVVSASTQEVSPAEEIRATSLEFQHGSNAMHQASSSDHISRREPEAAPNGEHPTSPSGPGPVAPLSSVATDVPEEIATAKVEKASDALREECANGEGPTQSLEVGCSSRVTECCSSVEDCNGSASESGVLEPSAGSNLSQQHNTSLGSEGGNKLTNLGADIMRTVSPTSPGSYPVR